MEVITGVEAAAVLGKNAFQIFPFLKEVGQDEFFLKALRGESCAAPLRKFVIPWTNRTGFIETHFGPYRNQQKEVIGGMAIVRDSSARTQREANDEMFRSIADSIPHMVWVTDDQSKVNYFNQRWYDYTGLDQKSHPVDAIDLVHPDDREAITAAAEQSTPLYPDDRC